ncbi:MAG: SLC13 family permease [Erysipelotrichaceae bacterium]|nr:SLC13 family permease [Erysipelotrichaceae bacterium]
MNTQLIVCLCICVLVIAGYIWNKLSVGTVGCLGMVLFLITGCITPQNVLANIGNANLIMISSMFIISEGFKRTQAIKLVADTVRRISKGSMTMVMLGFTLASVIAATFTGSAVAAFCIVAPIVTATCEEMNISVSKTIFCVGLTCIAACGIIPVGGSLSMLAELNGYIAANEYEQYTLAVMDLFKSRGLSLVALVIYSTFIGYRFAPEKPVVASTDSADLSKRVKKHEALTHGRELIAIAVFCLVTLLLVFNTQLNGILSAASIQPLASWEIAFIGAVILVATGVLSSREACGSIPIDLCLMVVGGLCMGTALANTGAGDLIGNAIASVATKLGNAYLIGAVFYLIPFFLTQIMQNRTVMAVFAPIAILACKSMGVDCTGPLMLVASACCTAFMTPMATPTVPLVMGIGGYDLTSNMKQSILPAIILSIVNIFWIMTVYPL